MNICPKKECNVLILVLSFNCIQTFIHMNNDFATCYAYSVMCLWELNLVRAWDEDTGPDSCFWEFHSSSVTLEIFDLL